MINRKKLREQQERKKQQTIHNEKMNGTLQDVVDYCVSNVVSSKDELTILINDSNALSKLSTFQLTTLRTRLGELGCTVDEIKTYAIIIEDCINAKKANLPSGKIASIKEFRKKRFSSKLGRVRTPSEQKAAKGLFKTPSAHIIFHRNG
jgi:hypothetical protein